MNLKRVAAIIVLFIAVYWLATKLPWWWPGP